MWPKLSAKLIQAIWFLSLSLCTADVVIGEPTLQVKLQVIQSNGKNWQKWFQEEYHLYELRM